MTLAQERLKEVRKSLKVLLVLIVISNVADHSVAFLSRLGVVRRICLLWLEDITAILTADREWLGCHLLLRLTEEAIQSVLILRTHFLNLISQVKLLNVANDGLHKLVIHRHASLL